MRVIAGIARSLPLKTIEGKDTRPTTDRIKETLFNMINPYISDCIFVDLFSGSGSIGIEALSRGGKQSIFVENNKKACECIKHNLQFTKFTDKALVLENDVLSAISVMASKKIVADIIFMDPPYNNEHEKRVLEVLKNSPIINEDTMIIVEASKETNMDYVSDFGFEIYKTKEYKTNKHVFIYLK